MKTEGKNSIQRTRGLVERDFGEDSLRNMHL